MGGRILIVDDVATNRIVMKVKLTAAGYLPMVAATGAACIEFARAEVPDLILLDLNLPDQSGLSVLAQLRADPVTRPIPVVMFSANHTADSRTKAFLAGTDDFLAKPVDDQTLLARIRSLVRAREMVAGLGHGVSGLPVLALAEPAAAFASPGLIALVLRRPEQALILRRDFTGRSTDRMVVMSPEEALAAALRPTGAPDLFVIDADLAVQGGGLRLMSELRSRASTRHAGFVMMLGADNQVSPAMAFDLGADDLLTPASEHAETALRLIRVLHRKREADHLRASVQNGLRMAVFDPLTGLHNRRFGLARLRAIAEEAAQSTRPYAVLVADIDRFKRINDDWGHAAGDGVLVEVAARLRQSLRAGDLLARIGGEEFLIALPEISLQEARLIAERLCEAIKEDAVALGNGRTAQITISIGLAISETGELPQPVDTVSGIVERADRALLRSKAAGRNQVTICRTAA